MWRAGLDRNTRGSCLQLVTLDFETFYDTAYSIRNKDVSTSGYVRDKRFEVISCSIKLGSGETVCYFGMEAISEAFRNIDWADSTVLAHHTHFDGLILSHHFGIVPARYACTLSMARALHPKASRNSLAVVAEYYGEVNKLDMPEFKGIHLADLTEEQREQIETYNIRDVDSCYAVYQRMLHGFPESELDLIDITVRMFADPILRVDIPKAQKELEREQTAKAAAIDAAGVDIKVLSSSAKFAAALEAVGVVVPTKDNKPSPGKPVKKIPAVAKSDEAFQALLTHPDPRVVKLVEARLAAKSTLSESRAARMIAYGTDMNLPIYLNYAMAHTLRWSGGDKLNPQNFKQKKKAGGGLRSCILAPEGGVLVVVDAAQIEARVVAWLAGEDWVLDAFRGRRDIYSEFASPVYGRKITKEDEEERFVGKTCILGLGFGMGAPKLQNTLLTQSVNQGLNPVRLSDDMCDTLVTKYRKDCRKIVELWDIMNDQAIAAMYTGTPLEFKGIKFTSTQWRPDKLNTKRLGLAGLPNGLNLMYPELLAHHTKHGSNDKIHNASYLGNYGRTKIYGGYFTENVVQALARIIVGEVMRIIARKYRVVMMTHDEIVFVAPEAEGKAALAWAIELMSQPPWWAPDLPLFAEGGFDVAYIK